VWDLLTLYNSNSRECFCSRSFIVEENLRGSLASSDICISTSDHSVHRLSTSYVYDRCSSSQTTSSTTAPIPSIISTNIEDCFNLYLSIFYHYLHRSSTRNWRRSGCLRLLLPTIGCHILRSFRLRPYHCKPILSIHSSLCLRLGRYSKAGKRGEEDQTTNLLPEWFDCLSSSGCYWIVRGE
jgi:hypothetical protein